MRVRRDVRVGYGRGAAGALFQLCGTLACVTLVGCAATEPDAAAEGEMAVMEAPASEEPGLAASPATGEATTSAGGEQPGMVMDRGELPPEYDIDIDESTMLNAEAAPDRSSDERLADAGDGSARLVTGFSVSGLSAWGLSESDVTDARVELVSTPSGWVEARGGDRGTKRVRLGELTDERWGAVMYDSAMGAVHDALAALIEKAHPLHFEASMLSSFSVDQVTGVATASVGEPGGIVGDSGPYLVRGIEVVGLEAWDASDLAADVRVRVRETDFGLIAAEGGGGRAMRLDRLADEMVYQSVLDAARQGVIDAMLERFPHHFASGSVGAFVVDPATGVATLSIPGPGALPGDDGPYLVRGFVVEGLGAWGIRDEAGGVRVNVDDTGLGLVAATDGRAMSLDALGDDRLVHQSVLNAAGAAVTRWMLERHGVDVGTPVTFTIDEESGIAMASVAAPGPLAGDSPEAILVREVQVTGGMESGLTESDILDIRVTLAKGMDGFFGARPGLATESVRIGDLPTLDGWGAPLYTSALPVIAQAVTSEANEARGIVAVRTGIGLSEDGVLRIDVTQGTISALRTVVNPEADEPSLNEPQYDQIREHSPVQEGDLVHIEALDSYVHRLNRRPGRQVDLALAPGTTTEGTDLTLDYLIGESDPFMLYAQASNTGTEETSEWRERFGLAHYNLTNFDDVLTLDYITGDFDSVHALTGSYERPFTSFIDPLRWRVFAKWISYDASEVGFGSSAFEGETFGVGGELIWNVWQGGPAFIDLVGGIRYEDVTVDNNLINVTGESSFVLPYIGSRFERQTGRTTTSAGVFVEWGSASEDPAELAALGRFDVEDSWTAVRWDASHSFYLDPFFGGGWKEGADHAKNPPTLAHEVVLMTSGQWSEDRLVPNFVETVGGFYSVRGYPEAFAFGDQVYTGTIEYRFHLPRAMGLSDTPGTFLGDEFRWVPQEPLGPTDWDLIFRAFVDAGRAEHVDPLIFEDDATLVGAGVGVELTLRRNVSLRVDWGMALKDAEIDNEKVTAGSSRVHMAFTLVF